MNCRFRSTKWLWIVAGAIAAAGQATSRAEESNDRSDHQHRRHVYQRRAFEWAPKHDRRRGFGHKFDARFVQPQVSSGWFQRPYPYHLDYYKMRYGGSYAPYFGNLYGPPQVVTAPPYYGPYYGDFGYGQPGGSGPIGQYPGNVGGIMYQPPMETPAAGEPSGAPARNGELPSPMR